jgi:hypothetical protein
MQGADGTHVVPALPPVGPSPPDLGGRMKRIPEQPVGVQLQEPLAFLHVALAPGQVLGVPRVDQIDLEAARLEDFVHGDPLDPGGLQGDGRDTALQEPVGEPL